jgi:hypothetical protein
MNAAAMAAKYERPTAVIMKEVPSDMTPEAVDARIRELMKRVLPGTWDDGILNIVSKLAIFTSPICV